MKTNIRDVAKHAGVSTATVSHVLNNSQHVSEPTKQRVLASVKELNYSLNATAKSFRCGRRNIIGCIIPDISNYFWALAVDEIEATLSAHGYNLLITNTKELPDKEIADIKLLSSGVVDGIIVGSTLPDCSVIDEHNYSDIPIVFIDRELKNCLHDKVLVSNYTSMYNGVSYLIEKGNHRIGYIAGLRRLSTTIERIDAFKEAVSSHGISLPNSLIKYGDSMCNSAIQPAMELIEDNCSAIVISNNIMAADVMSYLFQRRKELSRRIDILGYQEGLRDVFVLQPSGIITQPSAELGKLAANLLLKRLESPDSPIQTIKLNSTLTLYNTSY